MAEDITLLDDLRLLCSYPRRYKRNGEMHGHHRMRPTGRLYYFQGNFFRPLEVHGSEAGRIKRAMRQFVRAHRDRILADRAGPDYQTLEELADL